MNHQVIFRVKISPLLWLHRNLRLSYQKTIKVKWLGISLVFRDCNRGGVRTNSFCFGGGGTV